MEEACKKQGFNPEEYDLKHHRNVLDTSVPLRFSGLPNNALVEMVPITKLRSEGDLTLGVHLENGERVTGKFQPHDKLIDVIKSLCPNAVKLDENPVVIYMRREVYGKELHETSLRDLGLTNGRAMVRLIHRWAQFYYSLVIVEKSYIFNTFFIRTPAELKTQANVSAPLPVKPTEEKPYVRKLQKIEEPPKETAPVTSKQEPTIQKEPEKYVDDCEESIKKLPDSQKKDNKSNNLFKVIKQEKRKQTDKSPVKTCKKATVKDEEDDIDFVFVRMQYFLLAYA